MKTLERESSPPPLDMTAVATDQELFVKDKAGGLWNIATLTPAQAQEIIEFMQSQPPNKRFWAYDMAGNRSDLLTAYQWQRLAFGRRGDG